MNPAGAMKPAAARFIGLFQRECRTRPGLVLLVVLTSAVYGAIQGTLVLLTRRFTDGTVLQSGLSRLVGLLAVFLVLALLRGGLDVLLQVEFVRFSQVMMARMQRSLYEAFHRLPWREAQQRPVGDALAVLTSDAAMVNGVVTHLLGVSTRDLWSMVGILVAMAVLDLRLCVFVVLIFPALIFTLRMLAQRLRRAGRRVQALNGELVAYLSEHLRATTLVRLSNRVDDEVERFGVLNGRLLERMRGMVVLNLLHRPAAETLVTIAAIVVILVGVRAVDHGSLEASTLVPFMVALLGWYGPLTAVSGVYHDMQRGAGSLERVESLLQAPGEPAAGVPWAGLQRAVSLRGVRFAYDAARPVLCDLDLDIRCGETIAIVGRTGQGKSTLLRLLTRLLEPDVGSIRFDDTEYREIAPSALRARIGYATQDSVLLRGTLRENLCFAAPQATEEAMRHAARTARVDDVILGLPGGYGALVEECGVNLSGGERKRLCLARELLKPCDLLLLDEVTSEVDYATERAICDELITRAPAARTTILVSHRLAATTNVSRIIVLESGRVQESGTHAELMARQGLYWQLFTLQSRGVDV